MLWSRIKMNKTGWTEPNHSQSYKFGPDVLHEFLRRENLDIIVCSNYDHEGYEIVADRKMVKLFSIS